MVAISSEWYENYSVEFCYKSRVDLRAIQIQRHIECQQNFRCPQNIHRNSINIAVVILDDTSQKSYIVFPQVFVEGISNSL